MHWCLGMYGSASTWTFDLVRRVAAAVVPDRPVVSHFINEPLTDLDLSAGTVVVKTHAVPEPDELARSATAIIITIRDPRDAIASLMAHNKASFDLALGVTEATAAMCAKFATHQRAMLLRFEDRFFDDPTMPEKIAATFGKQLSDADRLRIFAETRRASIDAFIANIETRPTATRYFDELTGQPEIYDTVTLWHKHHAGRKGETGRWRNELSSVQAAAIEARLYRWMERFGYRPVTPRPLTYTLTVGRYDASF